jgi:hypothetical protein
MMVGEVLMGARRVKDNTYKKAIVIQLDTQPFSLGLFGAMVIPCSASHVVTTCGSNGNTFSLGHQKFV